MDTVAFARYIARATPANVRANLGWPAEEAILNAGTMGPYAIIVERSLRALQVPTADIGDADEWALQAVGEWLMWDTVAGETAPDVDESQGDRSTSLSQMHAHAIAMRDKRAGEAGRFLPADDSAAVVIWTPRRVPRRFSGTRYPGRRKASRGWS
jgi:hypothetical protein